MHLASYISYWMYICFMTDVSFIVLYLNHGFEEEDVYLFLHMYILLAFRTL